MISVFNHGKMERDLPILMILSLELEQVGEKL